MGWIASVATTETHLRRPRFVHPQSYSWTDPSIDGQVGNWIDNFKTSKQEILEHFVVWQVYTNILSCNV